MWKIKFLLLFTALSLASLAQAQQNIDRVVAVVGDKPVLWSELETQRLQAEQQGINLGANPYGQILDQLLLQYLLLHNAEVDSVSVPENQVMSELDARIRYFENQIGGRKKLEEFYGKSIDQIKEEFHDVIQDKLTSQAMESKIVSEVKVTPSDIRRFFEKIPVDSLPYINSQVEIGQITIVPKVSDEDKKAVREKLEKVRTQIIKGETSFCLEALYSEDPGTNSKCGEWDFVRRGTFVPEFDAIAFRLKDGEYSEVFETDYGFHFMQLIQRRGEEYKGRHILYIPKVSAIQLREAGQKLDSISTQLVEGTLSFEEAVLLYSTDEESKFNHGKMMNPATGDARFDIAELDPQLFITIDQMQEGAFSRPIAFQTPDGKQGYRILKLIKRTSPHRANLNDDYQIIANAAQRDKERLALEGWTKYRIGITYIWISEEFRDYEYRYPWVKTQ